MSAIRNSRVSALEGGAMECIEVYGDTIRTFNIVRYIAGVHS